jgi:hypothetical protein
MTIITDLLLSALTLIICVVVNTNNNTTKNIAEHARIA